MSKVKAAALAAVARAGCATIVARGPDQLALASDPSGADVNVNGKHVGRTPMVLVLDRGSPAMVEVALAGYKSYTMTLQKSFNYWTLGNIVFFPLVIVDLVDGAWQEYDDTPILVALHPDTPT